MRKQTGFTLIELVIVVGIIALLAAIAVPNYKDFVLEGRRTDATRSILECAAAEERRFTLNNSFTYDGQPSHVCQLLSRDRYYTLSVTDPGAANGPACAVAGNCYLITASIAAARDGAANSQLADTLRCDNFSLDSRGVRAATGNQAANPPAVLNGRCWRS